MSLCVCVLVVCVCVGSDTAFVCIFKMSHICACVCVSVSVVCDVLVVILESGKMFYNVNHVYLRLVCLTWKLVGYADCQ